MSGRRSPKLINIPLTLALVPLALALVGSAFPASAADSCRNSCVTMAIPSSPDGVQTRLDGSADAVLWPPSRDLKKIQISALNDRGTSCDVTIQDVRQDEAPAVNASGSPIDDAANCNNAGNTSSVELRSNRASNGDGRSYHISFSLTDPECAATAKADEVLVLVPRDDSVTTLKPEEEDHSTLTASYSGEALQCSPRRDDRLASR